MPNPSPALERAAGGLSLLVMLALLALTIGAPIDAAPAPIIIIATPVLERGAVLPPLPARLGSLEPAAPPVTVAAPAAQPEPSPAPTLEADVASPSVVVPVVELEAAPLTAEPPPLSPPPTMEPTAAIVRQVGRMTIVRERLPERQERP